MMRQVREASPEAGGKLAFADFRWFQLVEIAAQDQPPDHVFVDGEGTGHNLGGGPP